MRAFVFLLLSSFLVLCLTSCGGEKGSLTLPEGGALGGGGFDVVVGASVSAYVPNGLKNEIRQVFFRQEFKRK